MKDDYFFDFDMAKQDEPSYSCFVVYQDGIAVDVEIKEGEIDGAWYVDDLKSCQQWKAGFLDSEEEKSNPYRF